MRSMEDSKMAAKKPKIGSISYRKFFIKYVATRKCGTTHGYRRDATGLDVVRSVNQYLVEWAMSEEPNKETQSFQLAMSAAGMYVRPYVSLSDDGGTKWVATDAMPLDIWGDKKRLSYREAASRVLSAWTLLRQEEGYDGPGTNPETIAIAMKKAADDLKEKKKQALEKKDPDVAIENAYKHMYEVIGRQQKKWTEFLKDRGMFQRTAIFDTLGELIQLDDGTMGPTSYEEKVFDILCEEAARFKVKNIDKAFVNNHISRIKRRMWRQALDEKREEIAYDGHSTFEDFKEHFMPLYATLHEDISKINPDEVELDIATFYHFIYQVKRKVAGDKVESPLIPIIYGTQNIGKEYFLSSLLHPMYGWVHVYNDIAELGDTEKHAKAASENLVGYLPEMSGVDKADMNKVKASSTSSNASQRMFNTQDHRTLVNRITTISSANTPFKLYSRDLTGSRRFKEVRATLKRLTPEIEKFRGDMIRDFLMAEGSWAVRDDNAVRLWRMVDAKGDAVFKQRPDLKEALAMHQDAMTPTGPIGKFLSAAGPRSGTKRAYIPISAKPGDVGAEFVPLKSLYKEWTKMVNSTTAKTKLPDWTFEQFCLGLDASRSLEIARFDGVRGLWLQPEEDEDTAEGEQHDTPTPAEDEDDSEFDW